jgi:hypothetical protein
MMGCETRPGEAPLHLVTAYLVGRFGDGAQVGEVVYDSGSRVELVG